MNRLYLFANPPREEIVLAIGGASHKRRVYLTAHEAQQLAYRLMSLAAGGETHGMERFAVATPENLP
jgi:hypothetical protein